VSQEILDAGLRQRLDLECEPLMDSSARHDCRETAVIEDADRFFFSVLRSASPRDEGGRFFFVAREDGETTPAPMRIGERGRYRMPAI
jgi:hypothetical protein